MCFVNCFSTILIQCFSTASALLQHCFSTASTLLQHCFSTASALLQHCFGTHSCILIFILIASALLQQCFTDIDTIMLFRRCRSRTDFLGRHNIFITASDTMFAIVGTTDSRLSLPERAVLLASSEERICTLFIWMDRKTHHNHCHDRLLSPSFERNLVEN